MTQDLPPNPSSSGTINNWAAQMYDYMLRQIRAQTDNDPFPIQLTYRVSSADLRAAQDGVLLWDPTLQNVVVSKNGAWTQIGTGGGGSLPAGGVAGQLLTKQSSTDGDADWEDLVLDGGGA